MSRRSRSIRRRLRSLIGRDLFQRSQCHVPMLTLYTFVLEPPG